MEHSTGQASPTPRGGVPRASIEEPSEPEFDVLDAACPSHAAMRDVTGRWAPLVLLALSEGCTRFGEIHRRVGGSSERMISQTLRTLQEDAMIERTLDADGRPAYTLTDTGREIADRVHDLSLALYAHLRHRRARSGTNADTGTEAGTGR